MKLNTYRYETADFFYCTSEKTYEYMDNILIRPFICQRKFHRKILCFDGLETFEPGFGPYDCKIYINTDNNNKTYSTIQQSNTQIPFILPEDIH